MKTKMADIVVVLARFFANEFMNRLVPERRDNVEKLVTEYRGNIQYYVNALSLFPEGENKFYDQILLKFFQFAKESSIIYGEKDILEYTKKICVDEIWNEMRLEQRLRFFRKFITKLVEKFQVIILASSLEYCTLIMSGTALASVQTKIRFVMNEMIDRFTNEIRTDQFRSQSRTSVISQGRSVDDFDAINSEQKMFSQYREMMEKLSFENEKLKEENQRLRDENMKLIIESGKKAEEEIPEHNESEEEALDITDN